MKKILIIFILIFFNIVNVSAYNLDKVYQKIDVIYIKNPSELEKINQKIKLYINKIKDKKKKDILKQLNNYINFKFKNKDYYNQKISVDLKNKIKQINNSSFTDQERLEKFNTLLKTTKFSNIEKEFINFSIFNAKLWILLNHQKVDESQIFTKNYFSKDFKNKLNFLFKNADYYDFSILPQLFLYIYKSDINKFLEKRFVYFPDEKYTAYNLVRLKWYYWLDCQKLTIKNINLDLIDKKFCKAVNWKFELSDLDDVEKLNNNLQNISDKANYYSNILYFIDDNDTRNKLINKFEKLWKKIISSDKNFVNGYLILLKYYDLKWDCKKFNSTILLFEKNFVWDENIKNRLLKWFERYQCYWK